MPSVLAQATVVCLPSYREGMPKVLLEAAASGRAIVTTDAPGCRDVVEGGRLGPLVPPRDAVALAHALRELVEDAPRRRALAAALAAHARAHFDEQQVLAAHLEVYRSLGG
jgi:glycosyltransferase involved in cell wall biosynthesis